MADCGEKMKQLEEWDKKYIWHPFTQMRDWESEPVTIIEKAKGNYLFDIAGKKYLDGVSSLWVNVHGHNDPVLSGAVKKQLAKVAHTTFLGLSHPPAIILGKRLVELAPGGLTRVFYSDNGSTAVEIALKMAYQYWHEKNKKGKYKYLVLENSYHGDTIGSVSVGGIDIFHSKFKKLLFKTYKAPSPYCYRCPLSRDVSNCGMACLKKVEGILKKYSGDIAACIVEPQIQAAAGMIKMPRGYMNGLEKLCRKYDVLLIADEVATAFGRTGRMFACEIEGIKPDFLCLAKGLTGGYLPVAATLTTREIYSAFLGKYERFKTFFHGHTYTANPLGCAAAVANLDILKKRNVIEKNQGKIEFMSKMLEVLKTLPVVGDIRQLGLMAGIELVRSKELKAPFPAGEKAGAKVCMGMRRRGVILRPLGNVIVLMPPLSITKTEIKNLVESLIEEISRIF